MKHILFLLLALMTGTSLKAQENLPDTSLFEAHRHIEGNDTLPYRLYRSQKVVFHPVCPKSADLRMRCKVRQ